MRDVTRALVLPDQEQPSMEILRNMSIYWDFVVCPCYDEEPSFDADDPLVREGVVGSIERDIPADKMFPKREGVTMDELWGYQASRDEDGEFKVELTRIEPDSQRPRRELRDLSDAELEGFVAIEMGRYLGFVDDSLAIAASNNFAPVSHSLGGHLATVIGSSDEEVGGPASREAALLSVVVEAFAIDPSVSSEDILRFRSKNGRSQARLRASLVDLAAALQNDSAPEAMLSEARDTYKNRVEPALGGLEEALKESQIKFWLKSLMGATAIVVAPIEPVSTSVGAAQVMGQSIGYSYSKSRLIREHPYGYLHEVNENLGLKGASGVNPGVETAMMEPRKSLWDIWHGYWLRARDYHRQVDER